MNVLSVMCENCCILDSNMEKESQERLLLRQKSVFTMASKNEIGWIGLKCFILWE